MTGSNKSAYTPPALLLILLSCFCLSAFAADAVPAAEDIDRLAETAKTVKSSTAMEIGRFMRLSSSLRIRSGKGIITFHINNTPFRACVQTG